MKHNTDPGQPGSVSPAAGPPGQKLVPQLLLPLPLLPLLLLLLLLVVVLLLLLPRILQCYTTTTTTATTTTATTTTTTTTTTTSTTTPSNTRSGSPVSPVSPHPAHPGPGSPVNPAESRSAYPVSHPVSRIPVSPVTRVSQSRSIRLAGMVPVTRQPARSVRSRSDRHSGALLWCCGCFVPNGGPCSGCPYDKSLSILGLY